MKYLLHFSVVIIMFCSCKKVSQNQNTKQPQCIKYIDSLSGSWNFKHIIHYEFYGHVDTIYRVNDTSFYISKINDTMLEAFSFNMHFIDSSFGYYPTIDTSKFLLFVKTPFDISHDGAYIQYFFNNDSLVFSNYSSGLGGSATQIYIRNN